MGHLRIAYLVMLGLIQVGCGRVEQDELECILPNGNSLELVLRYDYYPMAKYFSHAASRLNTTSFEIYYRPAGESKWAQPIDFLSSTSISTSEQRVEVCSRFSSHGDSIYTDKIIIPSIKKFIDVNPNLSDFKEITEYKELANEEITRFRGGDKVFIKNYFDMEVNGSKKSMYKYPIGVDSALVEGLIYFEIALQEKERDGVVAAVYRVSSEDSQKTWSKPVITSDSKLFVIGKTIPEQPSRAKPGRYKIGSE